MTPQQMMDAAASQKIAADLERFLMQRYGGVATGFFIAVRVGSKCSGKFNTTRESFGFIGSCLELIENVKNTVKASEQASLEQKPIIESPN
jgi:hypothetical protein